MKNKRLSVRFVVCLVTLVLVAGLVAACAEPAPAPTPEPTPAPSPAPPTPAPAPEVIELTWSVSAPDFTPPGVAETALAQEIEKRSGGRVKFVFYYSSSLFESPSALSAIADGLGDVSDYYTSNDPGLMQLNSIFSLPNLEFPPPEKAIFIIQELLDKFPEMMAEFEGVELIQVGTIVLIPTYFHTVNKQVKSVADLKGLKFGIAGGGGPTGIWMENLGIVPVAISFEDFYVSLERGLIDGHISDFGPQFAQGTLELCPYKADMGSALSIGYHPIIMNPDSFHSLPPDVQKIFKDRELWEFFTKTLQAEEEGQSIAGYARTKELGHTYVTLSEADKELLFEAAVPVHEAWIADVEAKGKPGREVYDEMMRIRDKYK